MVFFFYYSSVWMHKDEKYILPHKAHFQSTDKNTLRIKANHYFIFANISLKKKKTVQANKQK